METLLTVIFAAILIGGLLLYSSFVWGLVCYKFWYWFLIPVFPDLPLLTYWKAVGLLFFISLFKNTITSDKKRTTNEEAIAYIAELAKTVFLTPWVTLGMGYLVYLLINH